MELLRLFGAYVMLTLPIQVCLITALIVFVGQKLGLIEE